jgi:hypothetical protein
MISKNNILENISELKSFSGNRNYKYCRNYRYYNATKGVSLENIKNPMVLGYYNNAMREFGEEEDTSPNPLKIGGRLLPIRHRSFDGLRASHTFNLHRRTAPCFLIY